MGDSIPPSDTAESVTAGHPDKLCDAISDAILDECLRIDSNARVAVETMVKGTDGEAVIVLAGEVSLNGQAPNYEHVARETASSIGYTDSNIGMDATSHEHCHVQTHITTQSQFISQGVDGDLETQGAGDQGVMYGYACSETEGTPELRGRFFPLSAALAQRLTRRLEIVHEKTIIPWVRPDGKSQVTVQLTDDKQSISRVSTIVIASQHSPEAGPNWPESDDLSEEDRRQYIEQEIRKHVIEHAIPSSLLDDPEIIVNGTGSFPDPGGPYADAGLTGRKIIVDTYGGGRHGGGAFSGKDPSKVDRSAAYYARWVAKHVVASGLAEKCEIQVAYAIGKASPVGFRVNTFGTTNGSLGKNPDSTVSRLILENFDWRPAAMIRDLGLKRPIYRATSSGGHFGRTPTDDGLFPWERLDENRLQSLRNHTRG
jgi:S-adenosylmethionine synthetase